MSSALERLRVKREESANNTTVDLPVTGYGGEMLVRYRLVDPLIEGKEIGARIDREFKDDGESAEFYAKVDTLLAACQGFYMRGPDGKEAIDPDGTGVCVYEPRLADGLGIEHECARDILLGVFNGNKVAVGMHAMRFLEWMGDPEGFRGEA